MYRVECYNWPDICEDAGVYTSPRLFFYPKGTTDRKEYTGLWDKASIKDAILRYIYRPQHAQISHSKHSIYNFFWSRCIATYDFLDSSGTLHQFPFVCNTTPYVNIFHRILDIDNMFLRGIVIVCGLRNLIDNMLPDYYIVIQIQQS